MSLFVKLNTVKFIGAALLITSFSGGQALAEEEGFVPVYGSAQDTLQVNGTPDEVCPLFAPEWRKLAVAWWQPEVLKEPLGPNSLQGQVLLMTPPDHDGFQVITSITSHDPENNKFSFAINWGEIELQKVDVKCDPNPHGGTNVTITTLTLGLDDPGNEAVQDYLDRKSDTATHKALEKAVNKYLEENKSGH